ncbi:MAG: TIGR04282 family arsenosugar biosynthesis glycosyltransferase [Planctomycetaceae bacterium]
METIFGLFAKQPISGKVKTRLAAEIGPAVAAQLYEAFLTDLLDRFQSAAHRRVLGFSPVGDAAADYFENLAAGRYELWTQPETSLGDRVQSFFEDMLSSEVARASSPGRVVLIGSDSPTLPRALIEQAFAALETKDCVIGPATDGGFYLIGLRRRSASLFDNIDWGESRVLDQIVRNVVAHDFSLHLLFPWYDVDTVDDLHCLRGHLAALSAAAEPDLAPRTRQLLMRLCDTM